MKRPPGIILLLAVTLSTSLSAKEASALGPFSCSTLIAVKKAFTVTTPEFDLERFSQLKQAYSEELARGATPVPGDSPEARLAYLEAHTSQTPTALGLHLKEKIRSASSGELRRLRTIVKHLDLSHGVTAERVTSSLIALYRWNHGAAASVVDLRRIDPLTLSDQLIYRRLSEAIVTRGVTDSLQALGKIKDPTLPQKLRLWLDRNPKLTGAYAVAVNAIMAAAALPASRWIRFTPAHLEEALLNGVAETSRKIAKHYRLAALGESEVTKIRALVALVAIMYLADHVRDQIEATLAIVEPLRKATANDPSKSIVEETDALLESMEDSRSLEQQLFDMWVDDFTAEHGRKPTPKDPEWAEMHQAFFKKPAKK